ncbi:hypothetical protein [Paenibacillus sp. MBLB4367]|uniref:hypothetical protein n=1 Tax=Paenibacillus sp. MBLB4367 TaxID=3384767 RepID=UPI00390834A2
MPLTIGCLHAHYSNAGYFEAAASPSIRFLHFVEPGIAERLANDPGFDLEQASAGLASALAWIASCGADAILVTCTEYCALLPAAVYRNIPLLRLDELFFRSLDAAERPVHLVFTNPGTVESTMARLLAWHEAKGTRPDATFGLIEDAFALLMGGRREAYAERLAEGLRTAAGVVKENGADGNARQLAVAQLSMSAAGQAFEQESGIPVLTPLEAVLHAISELDSLQAGDQR